MGVITITVHVARHEELTAAIALPSIGLTNARIIEMTSEGKDTRVSITFNQ
jgi:hypothetical protein